MANGPFVHGQKRKRFPVEDPHRMRIGVEQKPVLGLRPLAFLALAPVFEGRLDGVGSRGIEKGVASNSRLPPQPCRPDGFC